MTAQVPQHVATPSALRVPLLDLRREYETSRAAIDEAVRACFEHQQWINGPEVRAFEDDVVSFLGGGHAVGVASGTDALVLALRALALQGTGQEYFTRDDVIITTAFTFTATGDAILRAGATPVFVDIDPKTYALDPVAVASYLSRAHGRVVGILPVHLYGHPADMGRLEALASAHGCFLLEDAAQAFGAACGSVRIGAGGNAACLSFFPSKPLGCFGDGGMVTTNDAALAQTIRELRQHGGKDKYNVEHIGYNARLDTLQAAILRVKLRCVDTSRERRRRIAAVYDDAFRTLSSVVPPFVAPEVTHAYHQYTIRVVDGMRDELQRRLTEHGVQSMVYYATPLHHMALFRDRAIVPAPLTETERAAADVVSIPIDSLQTNQETAAVIAAIQSFA